MVTSDIYLDDELLIQRSQRGDREAFDTLVRKHEAKAYQYAYRLTRNQDEASDIVAEAFVRVYNAIHNFKSQAAFGTWLFRILTNCFLDLKKKEKNRPTTSLESSIQTSDGLLERQIEDPKPSPLEQTFVSERSQRIADALKQVPEYQRSMILMYHAEQMSYEDIAAALDLPIGTVKSRLNRARIALREILVKDEELFKLG
jgi:RNA polymerase sigma-70 factor, ECF subfamily